jgi:hypothetical protein
MTLTTAAARATAMATSDPDRRMREIACYVRGAHRASVLIAATPDGDGGKYAGLLEQAVSAFTVT